jgi:hypothetical protein
MPEWIHASEHALFNLDYIIGVRRNEDGTGSLIVNLVPDGVVTETNIPYDELVELIETISGG